MLREGNWLYVSSLYRLRRMDSVTRRRILPLHNFKLKFLNPTITFFCITPYDCTFLLVININIFVWIGLQFHILHFLFLYPFLSLSLSLYFWSIDPSWWLFNNMIEFIILLLNLCLKLLLLDWFDFLEHLTNFILDSFDLLPWHSHLILPIGLIIMIVIAMKLAKLMHIIAIILIPSIFR